MFTLSESWKITYPAACAGFLVMGPVVNPMVCPPLEERKRDLEGQLRARFAGQERKDIDALPVIRAYNEYYRRFKKSYHVQAQLESIAFKDKSIPSVAALVEAMFMAEVKNMLLTAGHDVDRLQGPLTVNVADGQETYTLLRGQEQTLKAGDMYIADQVGIISSVLYGPDQRTQINPETRRVIFTVYAPAGVGAAAVRAHLADLRDYVLIVSPGAVVDALDVGVAGV